MTEDSPDLAALLPSWQLAMRAERKSPATVASYTEGVLAFLRWATTTEVAPALTKTTVQAFTADLLDAGAQAATARTRHMALRRFAAWLAEEGELESNPLLGVKPPKLDSKVVDALTDEQLRLLIKACAGKDLIDPRDEAIVRLMAETGLRAGEVIGMQLSDVDLQQGRATVRRGKGGKGRVAHSARRLPPLLIATSAPAAATGSAPSHRCGLAATARRSRITA